MTCDTLPTLSAPAAGASTTAPREPGRSNGSAIAICWRDLSTAAPAARIPRAANGPLRATIACSSRPTEYPQPGVTDPQLRAGNLAGGISDPAGLFEPLTRLPRALVICRIRHRRATHA